MSDKKTPRVSGAPTPGHQANTPSVPLPTGRRGRASYAERRAAQERAERRRQQMTRWSAAAVVGVCIAIVALLFVANRTVTPAGAQTQDGISCDTTGHDTQVHYHQHLRMVINGKDMALPAQIGIYQDPDPTKSCLYWLHTHDTTGVIHVEAPKDGTYTLGNLFKIWGQPLSATQLMVYKTDASHSIKAYVNGALYKGNPADIQLKLHSVLTLEYGPPFVAPQPYKFSPNE